MQEGDIEFQALDRWYRGLRPDLDVPDLKRLWNTAISIRLKLLLRADCHDPEDNDELLPYFMSVVRKRLMNFNRDTPLKPSDSPIHEQDRIYFYLTRAINWMLLNVRRDRDREREQREENKCLWDGPTGDSWASAVANAVAPVDKTPVLTAVYNAVERLPPRDRDLIKMRYGTKTTFAKIADAFGWKSIDKARRELDRAEWRLQHIVRHEVDNLPCDDLEDFSEK